MEPAEYLETYCSDGNSTMGSFYSLDEAVWTSFSLLVSGMVVPCMRDQNELFSGPPELFQNMGLSFDIFHRYIPLVGLATQVFSLVMALIGYYSNHNSSGFACFGLRTLMIPFSIGVLLPVISGHVKANKDNIPHANYMKSIFSFILPIVFVAVRLPGIDQLLPRLFKAFKCCCNCCSPKLCFKIPDMSLQSMSQTAAKYLFMLAVALWAVISFSFAIGPIIVYIGNTLLVAVNAVMISITVAFLTYLATLLRKLFDYRSVSKAMKLGLAALAKEALAIKPQEFDLAQSLYIMSPMSFVYMCFGVFELSTGIYWGGDAYNVVARRSLDSCARAWRATFMPDFGREIITSSFNGHGLLNYAQSISTVAAIVLYINEVVFVTLAKYLVVRYAKGVLLGSDSWGPKAPQDGSSKTVDEGNN